MGRLRPATSELRERLAQILDDPGLRANRDLLVDILSTVVRLATGSSDRLDLKIANAALKEMQEGFEVFAPYRHLRKVTMFGSARTLPTDPLYAQTRDLAKILAGHGWSTVTGAGPGIMAAGLEGAGPEHSFGINIRLPFEQEANQFIASDPKLVNMKYFFTRKLLLIKESDAYAVLPGGFGTLDEAFELLTLLQTGKAQPAPVVLLDLPGGTYWKSWEGFVTEEVARSDLIGQFDSRLYKISDSVTEAAQEIRDFYHNYHSVRWVGDLLVVRLQSRPTEEEVRGLSERFHDITSEPMRVLDGPLNAERRGKEFPELPRISLRFDRVSYARLRMLIDELNQLASASRYGPPPTALLK